MRWIISSRIGEPTVGYSKVFSFTGRVVFTGPPAAMVVTAGTADETLTALHLARYASLSGSAVK